MIFTIAWRNIWRNKRRTIITAASIFFAVFFAVFTNSIQRGVWDNVIDGVIKFYFGYGQVHAKGYTDNPSIDNAFLLDDQVLKLEQEIAFIKGIVPRIESSTLIAYGTNTHGGLLVGTDPEKEDAFSQLRGRLIEGDYMNADDEAILLSKGIAKKLKVGVGDTVAFISQGYHGATAEGKYAIKGILSFGSPDLNKRMIYMPLKAAQRFFATEEAGGLITSAVLNIDNKLHAAKAIKASQTVLDLEKYELIPWQEMIPELVQTKEMKDGSSNIMLAVLYLIITFGVFGTILMMTKERQYEFGVLISVGMKRAQLSAIIWIETVFIGVLGTVIGLLASFSLTYYIYKNPIEVSGELAETYEKFGIEPLLPTAVDPDIFYTQAVIVFIITTILALYPLLKIYRLKPVEAMRA